MQRKEASPWQVERDVQTGGGDAVVLLKQRQFAQSAALLSCPLVAPRGSMLDSPTLPSCRVVGHTATDQHLADLPMTELREFSETI
jgi:hypothetical protein